MVFIIFLNFDKKSFFKFPEPRSDLRRIDATQKQRILSDETCSGRGHRWRWGRCLRTDRPCQTQPPWPPSTGSSPYFLFLIRRWNLPLFPHEHVCGFVRWIKLVLILHQDHGNRSYQHHQERSWRAEFCRRGIHVWRITCWGLRKQQHRKWLWNSSMRSTSGLDFSRFCSSGHRSVGQYPEEGFLCFPLLLLTLHNILDSMQRWRKVFRDEKSAPACRESGEREYSLNINKSIDRPTSGDSCADAVHDDDADATHDAPDDT